MTRALLYSFGLCLLGAALEGLFAGRGVKNRMSQLRVPAYAVPFWGWTIIGGLYYAICFAVTFRLLGEPPSTGRKAALTMLFAVMFLNAFWNYFFFRSRDLRQAFVVSLIYSAIACALFLVLVNVERTAAWFLLPYVLYLSYANIWATSSGSSTPVPRLAAPSHHFCSNETPQVSQF